MERKGDLGEQWTARGSAQKFSVELCHYTAEADLPASPFLTATATATPTLNAIPSLQAFGNLRIDSQTSHAQV